MRVINAVRLLLVEMKKQRRTISAMRFLHALECVPEGLKTNYMITHCVHGTLTCAGGTEPPCTPPAAQCLGVAVRRGTAGPK